VVYSLTAPNIIKITYRKHRLAGTKRIQKTTPLIRLTPNTLNT
jgi:hypothetical protein